MPDILLKRWNDWSAGIGHLVDDGRTPGMYSASGLLGLRGELRPAPHMFTAAGAVSEYVMEWTKEANAGGYAMAGAVFKPSGTSAPTVDGTSTNTQAAGATNTIVNHVVNAGDNRVMVVLVGVADAAGHPTGVTWNGGAEAFTKVGDFSFAWDVSVWYLVNPTVATANVVVTFAGARDSIVSAINLEGAAQASPSGVFETSDSGQASSAVNIAVGGVANGLCASVAGCWGATVLSLTNAAGQTETHNGIVGTLLSAAGYKTTPTTTFQPQYYLEEPAGSDSTKKFLYVSWGTPDAIQTAYATKVVLNNTNFGKLEAGLHNLATLLPGQAARYQGKWYWPAGPNTQARGLTVVGTGDCSTDTVDTCGTFTAAVGADHYANLAHQLVDVAASQGVNILKVDGNPRTEADWGAAFPAGDKNERAAGLRGLSGLCFVMNVEGLYSFNSKGRSRLVFEDFRAWRNVFDNIPLTAHREGLFIVHPSGLLYYTLGELPVNTGVDRHAGMQTLPPSGPTELRGGRYHSTAPVGDFVYAIYQPDPSSTSALVMLAYGEPPDLAWQGLGTITLADDDFMSGIGVVVSGHPVSDSYVTPTVFFGDGTDLKYMILDPRASPFRSRADTHKVNVLANAYMSELRLTEPMDLTRIIVRTSTDMVAGDEFQISLITDGTGRDENVGVPIKGSGARHVLTLGRHNVTSLVLHVNWAATSTANRVPPVIHAIELYGSPAIGQQSRGKE